jgi:NAD(P)-dependent dehydrogenase (short-subunit alcohol dehydrogenase family)
MGSERVVVVTGASAGVGRATAVAFARAGADVGVIARASDRLDTVGREIEALGRRAIAVPADVADPDAVEAAADAIEESLGPIDVWVNNAMVSVFAPLAEISPPDFRRVTEVTYLGYVYGTMAALKGMIPRDTGSILQVGSALAYRGIPLQSAYCGAKHAIQGFTESVRCELLHDRSRVRISMVQMPALNTPQFHWVKTTLDQHPRPVAPIYQPEVAARAIVWAADNYRREINVAAMTSATIIGDKVASGMLDHYLGRTGYDSQQAHEPIEPGRTDNLWEPVSTPLGTHGEFDDRAHDKSLHWWWTMNKRWAAPALIVGALLVRKLKDVRERSAPKGRPSIPYQRGFNPRARGKLI